MERLDRFSRQGLTFDVTDRGPLDGPVTLLLHGFPANRHSWDQVEPLLNAAGLRTLAFDQRGYSRGARPAGVGAYRPRELVRDAVALADAAGARRFSVVGHDLGGMVAWWLAMAAPRRVERVAVVSTPHPRAFARALVSSDQAIRSSYMALIAVPGLAERVLLPRLPGTLAAMRLPERYIREYTTAMSEPGALTGALNWYRAVALPGGGRPGGDGLVHVPTRYVWGTRDGALGRRAAELTERYVAAPYRFTELEVGHWIPEVAPGLLAEELLRP